jgi:hypothetical protein
MTNLVRSPPSRVASGNDATAAINDPVRSLLLASSEMRPATEGSSPSSPDYQKILAATTLFDSLAFILTIESEISEADSTVKSSGGPNSQAGPGYI